MRGEKNAYVCDSAGMRERKGCGHVTVTIDRDEGVTPFLHKCENCGQLATSCMYRLPPTIARMEPSEEWYRPDAAEIATLSEPLRAHIERGGLNVRRIASPQAVRSTAQPAEKE